MVLLQNLSSDRLVTRKIFLHLYGFIHLSDSIESDNHNGAIEICEKCLDK